MSHYQQKDVKDLYRPKDILFVVIGLAITLVAAVSFANFFTGWAGI